MKGIRQILWGLFKKVVIADNCATFVDQIFNNSAQYSGSTLLLGAVLFSFQIYGDFSGYTDIALGRMFPTIKEVMQILFTFTLTVLARVLYRAGSLEHVFMYLKGIFTSDPLSLPEVKAYSLLLLIAVFMIIEWIGRGSNYAIENIQKQLSWRPVRWVFYLVLIIFIFANTGKDESFIYFQF